MSPFPSYDPDSGRWTAKDPILFTSGFTDLYGYCLYDPVNFIDRDGRFPWGLAAIAAMAYGLYEFFDTANEAIDDANNCGQASDDLIEEADKGFTDPEYAQELKDDLYDYRNFVGRGR